MQTGLFVSAAVFAAVAATTALAAPAPRLAQPAASPTVAPGVFAVFDAEAQTALSPSQQARIAAVLEQTWAAVRGDFSDLAARVDVSVHAVARDLSSVGGVAGRAEAPGRVVIEISTLDADAIEQAIARGLAPAFAHELHHLVRGWTISGNRFGPGIATAAINEGLAVVYSEQLTGQAFPGNAAPPADTARAWAGEIRALPLNADYVTWMFSHPDGREGVGYRTGAFVVQQALAADDRDIIALSHLAPADIWSLAGFDDE